MPDESIPYFGDILDVVKPVVSRTKLQAETVEKCIEVLHLLGAEVLESGRMLLRKWPYRPQQLYQLDFMGRRAVQVDGNICKNHISHKVSAFRDKNHAKIAMVQAVVYLIIAIAESV